MSEPTDKAQWILTPLHPEGVSSTEYDKKFDKFLTPVNWDSAYFTEAEFERLVQYSKDLVEKYKPLTEEQIQEMLSKTFQKREDSVEAMTIYSLPYKAGGQFTVTTLKERNSMLNKVLTTGPNPDFDGDVVDALYALYDNCSKIDAEADVEVILGAKRIPPTKRMVLDYPRLLQFNWRYSGRYLRLLTKLIKGARNFNSRKARRKIKCRRR